LAEIGRGDPFARGLRVYVRNIVLEKEGRKERGRKREGEWNRWRTGEGRKKNGDSTERKTRYDQRK